MMFSLKVNEQVAEKEEEEEEEIRYYRFEIFVFIMFTGRFSICITLNAVVVLYRNNFWLNSNLLQ